MKKEENQKIYDEPSIFAVPCDLPFVVDSEKAKEFNDLKPNKELLKNLEEISKLLNIKVEIEPIKIDSPILRKIK